MCCVSSSGRSAARSGRQPCQSASPPGSTDTAGWRSSARRPAPPNSRHARAPCQHAVAATDRTAGRQSTSATGRIDQQLRQDPPMLLHSLINRRRRSHRAAEPSRRCGASATRPAAVPAATGHGCPGTPSRGRGAGAELGSPGRTAHRCAPQGQHAHGRIGRDRRAQTLGAPQTAPLGAQQTLHWRRAPPRCAGPAVACRLSAGSGKPAPTETQRHRVADALGPLAWRNARIGRPGAWRTGDAVGSQQLRGPRPPRAAMRPAPSARFNARAPSRNVAGAMLLPQLGNASISCAWLHRYSAPASALTASSGVIVAGVPACWNTSRAPRPLQPDGNHQPQLCLSFRGAQRVGPARWRPAPQTRWMTSGAGLPGSSCSHCSAMRIRSAARPGRAAAAARGAQPRAIAAAAAAADATGGWRHALARLPPRRRPAPRHWRRCSAPPAVRLRLPRKRAKVCAARNISSGARAACRRRMAAS